MTESAYFATQGQKECYKELEVGEYEILGTLDSTTCRSCGSYDGKHFPTKDMQVGVNAPPFHPNCRCTTIPYFDDEFTQNEKRAATDENGNYIEVGNMNYEEWKNKYVKEKTNYAKASDIFLYEEDDLPQNITIKPEDIIKELETSDIGKDTIEYLEESGVSPRLIYEPQFHSNRGEQPRIAAQTVIHEVTHQRFDIGECQWAEAVCMAKEKMHITGRSTLTAEEKRYIIKLAKKAYPEYNWKRGGYKGGQRF